jgi:hypothetical protein
MREGRAIPAGKWPRGNARPCAFHGEHHGNAGQRLHPFVGSRIRRSIASRSEHDRVDRVEANNGIEKFPSGKP